MDMNIFMELKSKKNKDTCISWAMWIVEGRPTYIALGNDD